MGRHAPRRAGRDRAGRAGVEIRAWLGPLGREYPVDGALPPRDALASDLRFVTAPGATFRYSNQGCDLLELVVEGTSGRPFAAPVRDEVPRPLGMDDASFAPLATVARGHERCRRQRL